MRAELVLMLPACPRRTGFGAPGSRLCSRAADGERTISAEKVSQPCMKSMKWTRKRPGGANRPGLGYFSFFFFSAGSGPTRVIVTLASATGSTGLSPCSRAWLMAFTTSIPDTTWPKIVYC